MVDCQAWAGEGMIGWVYKLCVCDSDRAHINHPPFPFVFLTPNFQDVIFTLSPAYTVYEYDTGTSALTFIMVYIRPCTANLGLFSIKYKNPC